MYDYEEFINYDKEFGEYKRGTQILDLRRQRTGFIVRVNWKSRTAYCRFWDPDGQLENVPCSIPLSLRRITIRSYVPQQQVWDALGRIESEQIEEVMKGLNDAS